MYYLNAHSTHFVLSVIDVKLAVSGITLKIRFLGGTRKIGRSVVALKSEKAQILLDYGVMMDREPSFPMQVPAADVDAIVMMHCHLDHTGAIPIFHIGGKKSVYETQLSFDLTQLLISDFIHLSSHYLPY